MLDMLPDWMSRGAQIGPAQQVSVTSFGGGYEDRQIDWPRAKYRAIFSTSALNKAIYEQFLDLFWTHDGGGYPFLVQIWTDYDFADEAMLGTVDGANKDFQLVKTYRTGIRTKIRPIEYGDPAQWSFVDGNGAPLTYSTHDKSRITFATAPTAVGTIQPRATVPLFWVPMTIENDWLPASVNWEDSASIPSVELLEWWERP